MSKVAFQRVLSLLRDSLQLVKVSEVLPQFYEIAYGRNVKNLIISISEVKKMNRTNVKIINYCSC